MRKRLATAALIAGLAGCADHEKAAQEAFQQYEKALSTGDPAALQAVVAQDRQQELKETDAKDKLELVNRLRPKDVQVTAVEKDGEQLLLKLGARMEGETVTGSVRLVQEDGKWRVSKEEWSIKMTAPPDAPTEPAAIPANIQTLLDAIAVSDPMAGSKAWLDLGAKYMDSESFLADLGGALNDPRPVAFALVKKEFQQAGKPPMRYYTAEPEAPTAALTLGQALRYHLWQYEDVSGQGFEGDFEQWWADYAPKNHLPL